ncbi:MAG: putative Acyl-homoserine lactone acylase QuiP [Promethearchaeota archaeon]|nr:MAG: putative Acyl-homoserine lactone acylase QuiP [Candidatus Lokiarchaeota archaeon]
MNPNEKKISIRLAIIVGITAISLILFSIPLGSTPALGTVLFPGDGIWDVPGEVPAKETRTISAITDEVNVIRDEWGIPHIYAKNEGDLSFALGYVHAQDRFFQMDFVRRLVKGQLSEVLGPSAINTDKFNLASGKLYWAEQSLQALMDTGEEELLGVLNSYVDGVNYYLGTHRNTKPMEYHILDFEPTEWSALDCMIYSKYMSEMLTWQYDDLYRYLTKEAFKTTNYYEEWMGLTTSYQIPICPNYGSYDSPPEGWYTEGCETSASLTTAISDFISDIEQIDYQKELLEMQEENLIGSNNWVVDGTKSSTGSPILCNDMHLAWNLPGIWYEAHLFSEDTGLNTYGFTLAGVPIPIVAHNEYVAWGMTNTGYDVMDWYYYNLDPNNPETHYIYNGESTAFSTREYAINVKGQQTEEFTVKETVHGPVLNDFMGSSITDAFGDVILAPQWTANDVTYEFLAIYGFNHATNREEFDEASKHFHNPAQNIVYADAEGNIAIRPTGKVPIREGNGQFPYNGSAGEGEWTKYVPFEELPNTKNPSQNYLASANQIVAGPEYESILQTGWSDGYRARRINELLSEAPDGSIDVDKMKEIQNDVLSSASRAFTPCIVNAAENSDDPDLPDNIDSVLTVLKNWDYIMDKDEGGPSIFRKWRDYYRSYTFDDELEEYQAPRSPDLNVLEYLTREQPDSHWFDDITTTNTVETRDDIIVKALISTISWLEEFFGSSEPTDWRWGELHKVYYGHILGLGSLSVGPFESDGSGDCVNPSGVSLSGGAGRARGGASERLIVDLNNLNNSISVIPSGQRGHPNSKHYSDQLEDLFLKGEYHVQYFTNTYENFPQNAIESQITFKPQGG